MFGVVVGEGGVQMCAGNILAGFMERHSRVGLLGYFCLCSAQLGGCGLYQRGEGKRDEGRNSEKKKNSCSILEG